MTDEPRFERKYVAPIELAPEIEARLRLHPAVFHAAYPPRWVNSLYFDTPDARGYVENVDGIAERTKLRLRWYGDLHDRVAAQFEIKTRHGLVGKKTVLAPDHPALRGVEPVLITRYLRRYYESFDHRFRVTLDAPVQYLSPSGRQQSDDHAVLELKYAREDARDADRIAAASGITLSRNSKYRIGRERILH